MEEKIVSTRVDKNLHNKMKMHDEINWSSVMRESIAEKISEIEKIV